MILSTVTFFSYLFFLFSPTVPRFCNQTILNGNCKKALKDSSTFIRTFKQNEFQQNERATLKKLEGVKNPQCNETLKQLACSLFTPPCKGNKRMTLCLSQCNRLRVHCPDAFKFSEVSSYCAEPAEGNSDNGLCELTRWPSARHWDEGIVLPEIVKFEFFE